ncbi:LOW QUALITY PROTEIN: short transient receptor potential channel 1-like [Amphiura filiformis]|uniref:LOW QUALITY PROTEIN: short transient receptor potential channel 1-like n=1 Tax=Amphiura filiformis TaxID=82378 RepID=UPI003B224429
MSRPSTPLSFEDQLLAAVKKGEVSSVNELIDRRDEIDLNINCKDINGQSALNIAITEGNLVVIYPLLESNVRIGDALLRAVDSDFVEAVRLLCEYAKDRPSKKERMDIIDCHCENDDFHPDVTPIVLAAHRNNFSMIKMLVEVGARIPEITADTFQTAATDSLQQSVGSLELYKGLASDAYVVLSSDDPINRCFTLCSNLRKLSEIEVEFKPSYLELIAKMENCSQELIGQARSTEEILTILTSQEGDPTNNGKGNEVSTSPLPTISRAIELEQRKFIASPNCQQAIISQFYRRLIYLRDKSVAYRAILFAMLLLHPILALLYLYVPRKGIREFVSIPYIKFILYIGSDLLLVVCLTMEAVLDRGVAYLPTLQQPFKIVICVWIFGLALFEVNVMRSRNAKKLLIQWRHIRDICIVVIFLYAAVFDAVAMAQMKNEDITSTDPISRSTRDIHPRSSIGDNGVAETQDQLPDMPYAVTLNLSGNNVPQEDITFNISMYPVISNTYTNRRIVGRGKTTFGRGSTEDIINIDEGGVLERAWYHPQLISRALFTVATVVSIARIFPYLVVSDVVGPLKISLGSMVQRTSHFFLVVSLVLLSFAVGLTYIYAYYNKVQLLRCKSPGGQTTEQICREGECREGDFKDLTTTLITLYWSVFGLNAMNVLELPQNAYMLERAGHFMYAIFYMFVVVVLLNALIAVMSQVYTQVEENADEEWKFSCTAMWMGFMEDVNPLPPPYNLLPSYENMMSVCRKLIQPQRWKSDREKLMSSSKQSERELTKTFLRESRKRFDEQSKERRYKKIMALLVDRYVTDKTAGESSTTADVTPSDVRGLKNDLIALRYETFLKMCKTHDHLVHVAEACLGIHGQSRSTNNIFQRTDVIEQCIQQHAKNVHDFHTSLRESVARLPPPPTPPPEPESGSSSKIMNLIKYYDKGGKKSSESISYVTEFKLEATGVDAELLAKRLERSPDRFGSQLSSESMESLFRKQIQSSPEDSAEISGLRVRTSPEEESSVEVGVLERTPAASPGECDDHSEQKPTESALSDEAGNKDLGDSS